MRVAIIGAGMAGLTTANILQAAGIEVTVFDKSKGTGGRLSSRSFAGGWIDHGAPYFSSDRDNFSEFLQGQLPAENLHLWQPKVKGALSPDEEPHWIGVPRNSAITRGLAKDICFQPSTRIARLAKGPEGWQLYNDGGSMLGTWPTVVVAIPAPQAQVLLSDQPTLAEPINSVSMEPCWVAAIGCKKELTGVAEVSVYPHPVVRRIINNSAKPGRKNEHVYLLQANKDWSQEHLEKSADWVGERLQQAFSQLVSATDCEIIFVHRWRYAFAEKPLDQPCLWDNELRIGVCGDWCLGRRVEDAWQSGADMATRILKHFAQEMV